MQFHYVDQQDDERAVLLGTRFYEDTMMRSNLKSRTLSIQQKQLQSRLVNQLLMEDDNVSLSKDIKTYRLFQGQLYNVDLEDKEAYNDEFQHHAPKEEQIQIEHNSSFQNYIMIGVAFLTLVLIGMSIYSMILFKGTTTQITDFASRHNWVHDLILDINRIAALLKDYSSGFSSRFPHISIANQVKASYDRIQVLKEKEIFYNTEFNLTFQSKLFKGSTFELVDLMLSHINEVFSNGDLSMVEDIHSIYTPLINIIEIVETFNIRCFLIPLSLF